MDASFDATNFRSHTVAMPMFRASFTSGKLAAGDYVFEAGVRNRGAPGPDCSSKLLLDDIRIDAAAVPEPGTWALMLAGFAGLGVALRRRAVLAA